MRKIVLASTSPRRSELLRHIVADFEVIDPDYEEDMTLPLPPAELATTLARGKATSVRDNFDDTIIISADTMVFCEDILYGKPFTAERARETLRSLRNRPNQVITGFAVLDTSSGECVSNAVVSSIHMRNYSDLEIDAYVETGEPLDKAGAYAINGIGGALIDRIEGDFSAIIGLPLVPVMSALRYFGVKTLGT